MPSKAQEKARENFSKARKAALKAGHKPFTKSYGAFIKAWFKKNKK